MSTDNDQDHDRTVGTSRSTGAPHWSRPAASEPHSRWEAWSERAVRVAGSSQNAGKVTAFFGQYGTIAEQEAIRRTHSQGLQR